MRAPAARTAAARPPAARRPRASSPPTTRPASGACAACRGTSWTRCPGRAWCGWSRRAPRPRSGSWAARPPRSSGTTASSCRCGRTLHARRARRLGSGPAPPARRGAGHAAHRPPARGLPEQAGLSGAARAVQVQMGYVSLADYVQFKVFGFDTKVSAGASQRGRPAAGLPWAQALASLEAIDLVGEPGHATDHACAGRRRAQAGYAPCRPGQARSHGHVASQCAPPTVHARPRKSACLARTPALYTLPDTCGRPLPPLEVAVPGMTSHFQAIRQGVSMKPPVHGFCASMTHPTRPARRQDFPYHLDPDVEHHNVWSTKPLPEAELHAVRPACLLPAWAPPGAAAGRDLAWPRGASARPSARRPTAGLKRCACRWCGATGPGTSGWRSSIPHLSRPYPRHASPAAALERMLSFLSAAVSIQASSITPERLPARRYGTRTSSPGPCDVARKKATSWQRSVLMHSFSYPRFL